MPNNISVYFFYLLFVIIIQVIIICNTSNDSSWRTGLLATTGCLFSFLGGFAPNYLNSLKKFSSLKLLNFYLNFKFKTDFSISNEDTFFSYIDSYITLNSEQKIEILKFLIVADKLLSFLIFPDSPLSYTEYIKETINRLSVENRNEIIKTLKKEKKYQNKLRTYIPETFFESLNKDHKKDKKLILQLKDLITSKEISLRFANFFQSKEFDKNTPYLILGNYANISDNDSILNEWVKYQRHISLFAARYKNLPTNLGNGNTLVYLILPEKFYKSALDLFYAIKSIYSSNNKDIENSFLIISSIFYESTYIHIGKKIPYTISLYKNLRRFLYFKTGNENFAQNIDLQSELANSLDKTTFLNLIQKMPLTFYLNKIKLTKKEFNFLETNSNVFYENHSSIESFINIPTKDYQKELLTLLPVSNLKYSEEDYSILKTNKEEYRRNKNSVVEKRIKYLAEQIVSNYNSLKKLIK